MRGTYRRFVIVSKFVWRYVSRFVLVVTTTLIVSCGGGGSGGGDTTSTPAAPSTDAGTNSSGDTPVITAIDPGSIDFAPYFSPDSKMLLEAPEDWEWDYDGNSDIVEVYFIGNSLESGERLPPLIYYGHVTDSGDDISDDGSSDSSDFVFVSSTYVFVDGIAAVQTTLDSIYQSGSGEEIELRTVVTSFDFNDGNYGIVYVAPKDYSPKYMDIYDYVLDHADVGLVVFDDLTEHGKVSRPSIASDGQNFLVVSCRYIGFVDQEVVGKIFDGEGSISSEFLIEDEYSSFCGQSPVSITFDGINYLVAYVGEAGDIQVRRISPAGDFVDEAPINISADTGMPDETYSSFPSIASDGNRSLVVWYEDSYHPSFDDEIRARFISTSGVLSDPVTLDNSSHIYRPQPRVTYGSNHYFVAWNPFYNFASGGYFGVDMTIRGQLVDLSGNLVLAEPLAIRSDLGDTPRYVEVASDGTDFLVAWIEGLARTDDREFGSYSIFAKRINTLGLSMDGAADNPGVEIVPPYNQDTFRQITKDHLDLIYDHGSYLFSWSVLYNRNYAYKGSLNDYMGVYGARASTDLAAIGEPLPIAGNNGQSYVSDLKDPAGSISASTEDLSVVVWVSKDGVMEAWTTDHLDAP